MQKCKGKAGKSSSLAFVLLNRPFVMDRMFLSSNSEILTPNMLVLGGGGHQEVIR